MNSIPVAVVVVGYSWFALSYLAGGCVCVFFLFFLQALVAQFDGSNIDEEFLDVCRELVRDLFLVGWMSAALATRESGEREHSTVTLLCRPLFIGSCLASQKGPLA
jgi:hypothetical protein